MFKLMLAAAVLVASIVAAKAAEWESMTNNPIMNRDNAYTSVWVKHESDQDCVLGVTKAAGTVEAAIFRGSILKKDLKGSWHLATYSAPNVAFVKTKGLKIADMYGTMVVGMEMADLAAFNRQCDGLPPL